MAKKKTHKPTHEENYLADWLLCFIKDSVVCSETSFTQVAGNALVASNAYVLGYAFEQWAHQVGFTPEDLKKLER